jgi:hypothetical protein
MPVSDEEEGMSPAAAELVRDDRAHLIHPLHHPADNANPGILREGPDTAVTSGVNAVLGAVC